MEPIPRPIENQPRSRVSWFWWCLAAFLSLAGLAVLYWFPPGSALFYPRCLFHQVTGLNCPGCGGLRAAHHLLHGHWRAAFALNPLLFFLLPMFGWFATAEVLRLTTGRRLAQPFKHPAWIWLLAVLVVGFGIARNLPMAPFASLAP